MRLTFDDGIDVRAVEQVDVEVRPSFQDCFAAAGAGHPTVTEGLPTEVYTIERPRLLVD